MRQYPHLAARIFNTPLLIHPAKLDAIIAGLGERLLGLTEGELDHDPTMLAGAPDLFSTRRASNAEDDGRPYGIVDGVAVLGINGALVHRTRMEGMSTRLLGYNTLSAAAEAAMDDPDVHAVLQVYDSPGGEVQGAFEYADRLRAMRGRKPMWAVADGMAASAAYLGGSAADRLYVTGTGFAGSIGVVMRHVDFSSALARDGIRVTHIYAGDHKIDGNPYEPLPTAVRADYQEEIDALYGEFVAAVVAQRGLSRDAVIATQARTFRGAQAVAAGLADGVATTDSLIAQLAAMRPSKLIGLPARNTANRTGAHAMGIQPDPAGVTEPAATAAPPAAVTFSQSDLDRAREEGRAEGLQAGADAERARIRAVEAQALPGHEALIADMKFDGKTTGPEAAVRILAAEREKGGAMLAQLAADAPAPVAFVADNDLTAAPPATAPSAQNLADQARVRVASAAAAGRSITVAQAIAQLKQEATHG